LDFKELKQKYLLKVFGIPKPFLQKGFGRVPRAEPLALSWGFAPNPTKNFLERKFLDFKELKQNIY